MVISTIEERERARSRLEQRSPQALAAFIMTLLDALQDVGVYVEAFIAADEPGRAAGVAETQIGALRRGRLS